MAKAKVGTYNQGLFDEAKENDKKSSGLPSSNWEVDDPDKTLEGVDIGSSNPWDNYYDPYSGIDKPEGAKVSNTLDEASIDRLSGSEVKKFGIRDYEGYGPINRILKWGTSGLTKETEQEYYDKHLKTSRTEDEQNLILQAEKNGVLMPEGDLWADNESLYKETLEDIEQEKSFKEYKKTEDYQRLEFLSGGVDTDGDGIIDGGTPGSLPGDREIISLADEITVKSFNELATNKEQMKLVNEKSLLFKEQPPGSILDLGPLGKFEMMEDGSWKDHGVGANLKAFGGTLGTPGSDDPRMQFDVKDMTRENYDALSAKWLTGVDEYADEENSKNWAESGVPTEVTDIMRESRDPDWEARRDAGELEDVNGDGIIDQRDTGMTMTQAMTYWDEKGSPEAKQRIAEAKAKKDAHRTNMQQNVLSTDEDMAKAQDLFDNLLAGNVDEGSGAPMSSEQVADKKAEEERLALEKEEREEAERQNDNLGMTKQEREDWYARNNININSTIQKIEPKYDLSHAYNPPGVLDKISSRVKNVATSIFGKRVNNNDKSNNSTTVSLASNSDPIDMSNPYGNVSNLQGGQNITTKVEEGEYVPSESELKQQKALAIIESRKNEKSERDPDRTIEQISADNAAGYDLDDYGNRKWGEYKTIDDYVAATLQKANASSQL